MQSYSLTTLADEHLAKARSSAHGRSAHTFVGGRDQVLRQMLLALLAGQSLGDHEAPGQATLHVLRGRVTLSTATDSWEGTPDELLEIPDERHDVVAVEDSVVVLTVAVPQPEPDQAAAGERGRMTS
jgi:quercetin dioxygenase-like cupin family protein